MNLSNRTPSHESRFPARLRPLLLLGTGVALCALMPGTAAAQDECGATLPDGGRVVCPASTNRGLSYGTSKDFTVVLQPGTSITNEGDVYQEFSQVYIDPITLRPDLGFPPIIVRYLVIDAAPDGISMRAAGPGVDLVLWGPDDTYVSGDPVGLDAVEVNATGTATIVLDRVAAVAPGARGIVVRGEGSTSVSVGQVDAGEFGIHAFELGPSGGAGITIAANVVNVAGRTPTSSLQAAGIFAQSRYNSVTVDAATVKTRNRDSLGILASAAGSVSVTSSTLVETLGNSSFGVDAASARGGPVNITTRLVTTEGNFSRGINSDSTGDIAVTSGSVITKGNSAFGMVLQTPGDIAVTSGTIVTNGDSSYGILAVGGSVAVVSTGPVFTHGAGSHGFVLSSSTGPVSLDTQTVAVDGVGAQAIRVGSAVHNTITVRGLVSSAQDLAIKATAGPVTLNTVGDGVIRGRIDLSDGADVVNNAGLFEPLGTSLFRGGADVFNNTGEIYAVQGTAGFDSVDFNSSGLIDMADGFTNDRLTIGGSFTGSGDGRLLLDVDFATRTADVLLVTGAATGSTAIEVVALGQSTGGLDAAPILLVDGGAGTQASAFSLAGGNLALNPFVSYGLVFDPAAYDFLLATTPSQQAFDAASFGEAIEDTLLRSADTVIAQLDLDRDGGGEDGGFEGLAGSGGLSAWGQIYRGERTRRSPFNTGYEQDVAGYQAGVGWHSDTLTFGVTGGLGESDVAFAASGTLLELESQNLGLYGQFQSGGLFVNALGQVDWIDGETIAGGGAPSGFEATAKTVRGTLGYRADFGPVWIEPAVSLAWTDLAIDPIASGGATLQLADGSGLRGAAGLRVGGDFALAGGTLTPFFGAHAVEQLEGRDASTLTFGSTLILPQDQLGTFGQTNFGLAFRSGMLELFVRGELEFAGDVDGHGGRAGLQLRF